MQRSATRLLPRCKPRNNWGTHFGRHHSRPLRKLNSHIWLLRAPYAFSSCFSSELNRSFELRTSRQSETIRPLWLSNRHLVESQRRHNIGTRSWACWLSWSSSSRRVSPELWLCWCLQRSKASYWSSSLRGDARLQYLWCHFRAFLCYTLREGMSSKLVGAYLFAVAVSPPETWSFLRGLRVQIPWFVCLCSSQSLLMSSWHSLGRTESGSGASRNFPTHVGYELPQLVEPPHIWASPLPFS